MSKVHLDRLRKKYGTDISGANYEAVVKEILLQNNENVSNKMARMSNKKWQSLAKKISTKEKRMVLPDMKEIAPPRAMTILKTAEKGKMITETLRDGLTRDLRQTLDEFSATGKDSYVRQTGTTAGRVNPQLVKEMENKLTERFKNYTKKDKALGAPPDVHRIAVTEVRSAINNTKKAYIDKVLEKNPDIEARKKWIHNKALSREPRRGHMQLNNKTVGINELFKVPNYKKIKGSLKLMGYDMMKHPHDPDAPADQVIQCNCDWDIIVSRRKK
jgi:hypothetical protein